MNIGEQGFPPMSLVISVSCSLLVQWLSSSTYLHFTNATYSGKLEQQSCQFMLCENHDAFFWLSVCSMKLSVSIY